MSAFGIHPATVFHFFETLNETMASRRDERCSRIFFARNYKEVYKPQSARHRKEIACHGMTRFTNKGKRKTRTMRILCTNMEFTFWTD
jgi:hypothetical protein